MARSEWIWEKLGFALFGVLTGVIWSFMLLALFYSLGFELNIRVFVGTSILLFVLASLVSPKLIGHAGLGAIVGLGGFLFGAFAAEGGSAPNAEWRKWSREAVVGATLGLIAGLITHAGWYAH